MTFSGKIAKLGQAKYVAFYVKQNGDVLLYVSNVGTKKKVFSIDDVKYDLGNVENKFIYSQMIPVSASLCVCRIDDKISVVEME